MTITTRPYRDLRDLGMTYASVCVETDNLPAIRLYESVGFRTSIRLLTYQKPIVM